MKQFCHHFFAGLTESISAGADTMCSLAGTSIELDLVAVQNTRPFHQAGTLSALRITVSANTLSSTSTWKTALGSTAGTDGSLSVTFSSGETGVKSDTSNTDDVANNDIYSFRVSAASGSGSITFDRADFLWEPDSGSITLLGCNSASSFGVSSNETTYLSPNGFRAANTTEARVQQIVTSAGTWRYLGCGQSSVAATAVDVTFTARVNGVDGNQNIVVDETDENSFVEDITNTDAVVSGDLLSIEVVSTNYSGPGSTNYEFFPSQIEHTEADETLLLMNGNRVLVDDDPTLYFPLAGQTNASATESNVQHTIKIAGTSSHFGIRISQSGGGTITCALRVGGSDVNQNVVIAGTGSSVDTSNTDAIADTDLLSFSAVTATGANQRVQSSSLRLTEASGSHNLTPNEISTTPVLDTPALTQEHDLTPNEISLTAQLDSPALSQTHDLTPNEISTTPVLDSPALGQSHPLTPDEISTAPVLDSPALTQEHALTPNEISTTPTLDSPALTQEHTLTADEITTTPVLDTPDLDIIYALTPDEISTTPTLDSPVITQTHALTPDEVSTTPVLDAPALGQEHTLTPDEISTTPTLDNPAITQTHDLTPNEISTTPVLDTPALGTDNTHALTPNEISTTPTLDSPALTQEHTLTADEVATTPVLDTPALTQSHALTPNEINTTPQLDSPTLGQSHALTINDVISGAPQIDIPAITQSHALSPNEITTTPVLDQPTLGQPGVDALTGNDISTTPILDTPLLTHITNVPISSFTGTYGTKASKSGSYGTKSSFTGTWD